MHAKFVDFHSGLCFIADYIKVREILIDLEKRSHKGGFVKWPEYYERLNLPVTLMAKLLPIMGRPEHKYVIEFELMPLKDSGMIMILVHD